MLVRSTEMVFTGGCRLRVDPVTGLTPPFEYTLRDGRELPKHLVPAEGEGKVERVEKPTKPPGQAAAPVKKSEPTKRELMAQLSAAGIKFKATLGAKELQSLLDAEKKKAAPAASSAPLKELEQDGPKGSGDQDVI